jgi:hypothetical protein
VANPAFPQKVGEQPAIGNGIGTSAYSAIDAAPPFTMGAETEANGYGTGYTRDGNGGFVDSDGKPVTDETTLESITDRFAKGDKVTDVPDHDTSEANMRPKYGMETAKNVIPDVEDQLASDIRFDMFDTVNPGFGEGGDNKLFLMEENREAKIVHAKPMFSPGSFIGPINGSGVAPWQLQRVMPDDKVRAYGEYKKRSLRMMSDLVIKNGVESSGLLGDDVGYPYEHSACELKRRKLSPFEPVIRTDMDWQHVKSATGSELNKLGFRGQTDAYRYPRHLHSNRHGMGGPVYPKRRGLEVILQ